MPQLIDVELNLGPLFMPPNLCGTERGKGRTYGERKIARRVRIGMDGWNSQNKSVVAAALLLNSFGKAKN